ncbi:MAG: S9 family peptidase, partial [Gammaproteobacteria bacterium]|nr:S9 family peptidase [Gammaproteobacteria bacterium]
ATPKPAPAVTPPPRIERGNLVLEGVPPHPPRITEALDGWLAGRSATFRDFLPDGSLLVTTRFGDADQVHRVATPLGVREQLTWGEEPAGGVVASPVAGGGFVFSRDRGGDENAQIHLLRAGERVPQRLTDGRSRHGGALWSRDGTRLVFTGNARDGIATDVYLVEVGKAGADGVGGTAPTAPRLVVAAPQGQAWTPVDWSQDGSKLLLLQTTSVTDARLYLADIATGAYRALDLAVTPGKAAPKTAIGGARFSADGRGVWLTADLGGEFQQLRHLDLQDGSLRTLTADIPWDIEEFEPGPDGRYLAYVANVDGYGRLSLLDLGAARTVQPAGLPADGIVSGLRFDHAGAKLGMSIDTARSPRDAWTLDIASGAVTRWTRSETGAADPARVVPAELVRYPTWDRAQGQTRRIPAFVYRPAGPGPHPVVIDIHGGPEGQSRPGYSAWTQYLVNVLGYAVIQPNVRGSTGYGRSYTMLDNGRLREDSVRDIGALLVWIAAQPGLDAGRVVVSGGSYGGYMVLASMVAFGDRLQGGIDAVGISNFVTFLTNTAAYRRDLRRVEYGDERDPSMRAFLQRISPLTRADAIRKPLLVIQGLNDPRVPASESEQMVARVRANGAEVWYLAARDEGHGFRKKPNRDFELRTRATFLERLKE